MVKVLWGEREVEDNDDNNKVQESNLAAVVPLL